MSTPPQEQISQLQQAIAVQESLRATLGDAVVDATVGVLREKLATLEAQVQAPAPVSEQRKQVSVLFADVSGFTAMSETMDAEEVLETMNALWARLDAAILDYGGKIDKHIGDAVMALFGTPVAHEDDPERAIRAALRMQAALARFRPPPTVLAPDRPAPTLRMRIGINTGPVLLGLVGTTTEYTAMGDTVNVASRLEHAAPIGGILISQDTQRHVTGIFDIETLEPITVKGKTEPIQVYVVRGERQRQFRMTTRGVEGVETPMIGRQEELARMQAALEGVTSEQVPHMITVVGEAGVGKSRLLDEFARWLAGRPAPVHLFRGRTDQRTSTLLPYALIRTLLADRFEIQDSDRAAVARAKLTRGITAVLGPDGGEQAHFIGHLIGLDFADSPYLRGILSDARQVRDLAFHYTTRFFAAQAQDRPVVLFLDDIHWADDGSLDLIDHLMDEGDRIPLLLVGLTRPTLFERRPAWGHPGPQYTRLDLQPLSQDESRRLVTEILRKVPQIPLDLSNLIVNGAEGNPFYLEELIKMLIEDKVIVKGADEWEVETTRLADIRVPPTLAGVLQARLDALQPGERETLQRAAVVGRTFWESAVDTLGTVLLDQHPPTHETLTHLRGKELIFDHEVATFQNEQEYVFRHALLHDVAYESVLRRLRRVYHAQVAEWLQARSGERVAEYAGLIGQHYELAGEQATAATWYGSAAKQAQDTYALAAAVDYYQKALAFLPAGPSPSADRVTLYEGLGEVLRLEARFAEADAALRAMITETEAIGDGAAQARAWTRLAQSQDGQGDHRAALDSATQAERVARLAGAQVELAMALFMRGWELYRLGEAEAALDLGDQALALSKMLGTPVELSYSLSLLGAAHNTLGHSDQATYYMEQALELDRDRGALHDVASSLNNLGSAARDRGDYGIAAARYEEALNMARKIGFRWGEMSYRSALSGVQVGLGQYEAAEAAQRLVIHGPQAARWVGLSSAYRYLAEACLGLGKLAAALDAALQALEHSRDTARPEPAGQAWRVLGLVAAHLAQPVVLDAHTYSAAACFAESLRIFTEMGAEGERARTLRAWAWYERTQGDPARGEQLWREAEASFAALGMAAEVARMQTAAPTAVPLAG
jgi:class 3 adenylate cyclase/tetratricopeptide (TPR) repeat protein